MEVKCSAFPYPKENGGVLLIALIVVAVVSILSGSILYMIKINVVQNRAIENDHNVRNTAYLSLKFSLATNDYLYTNIPPATIISNYSAGNTEATVTNTAKSIIPDSFALNNASAMLQYDVKMDVTTQAQHQVSYQAIVNAPSEYRQINDLVPQVIQNVNIPVVNLTQLNNRQKNASNSISVGPAGYIGALTVDNSGSVLGVGKEVVYFPFPTTTPASFALKFPNDNSYQLEQGWRLEDGEWYWSLLIYDVSATNVWQTEITLSSLKNLATVDTFSTLQWHEIISQWDLAPAEYNFLLQYPKGSYVTFDEQIFVSLQPINTGVNENPYNNPNDWRLVIPGNTYPQWNTNVNYYKGDIVTYSGIRYVATSDNDVNQTPPPSNRWEVAQFNATPWQGQVYDPGEFVTYSGLTFVNVQKSGKNSNPFDQPVRWRIVIQNNNPLPYNENIFYTKGLRISYDNQVFVNLNSTSNNPYQNNQNWWRIFIPENTAPSYNSNVRYYKGDTIIFMGTIYFADINYNSSINPGDPPPGNGWTSLP